MSTIRSRWSVSVRIVRVLSLAQAHPPLENTYIARLKALRPAESWRWQNGTKVAFIRGRRNKAMRTKTNCQAGGVYQNHNETLVRDNSKNLKVKTALRAGAAKRNS